MSVSQRKFAICFKTCKINLFPEFNNSVMDLISGDLVEIFSRNNNECQIKIRNFDKWSEKTRMDIYLCPIENLLIVSNDLWPFLIAIKSSIERLNLATNTTFINEILPLEIGSNVFVSPETFKTNDETLCKIRYKGIIPEIGLGFFFILELISENIRLKDTVPFIKKYIKCKASSSYFIITADWIVKYHKKSTIIPNETNILNKNNSSITNVSTNNINERTFDNNYTINTLPEIFDENEIKDTYSQETNEKPNIEDAENKWKCEQCTFINNQIDSMKCEMCSMPKYNPNFTDGDNDKGFVSYKERFECFLCDKKYMKGIQLRTCRHIFCNNCLKGYINGITECRIKCPRSDCVSDIQDGEIKRICDEKTYNLIKERILEKKSQNTTVNNFICSNCFKSCYQNDLLNPMIICDFCNFCSVCQIVHIGISCEEYQGSQDDEFVMVNTFDEKTISNVYDMDNNGVVLNSAITECPICHKKISNGIKIRACLHTFCRECLVKVVKSSSESGIKCPLDSCFQDLQDREIKVLGGPDVYEQILDRRLLEAERNMTTENIDFTHGNIENIFTCRKCGVWSIIEDCGVNFNCPNCEHCSVCMNLHLNQNCQEYFDNNKN